MLKFFLPWMAPELPNRAIAEFINRIGWYREISGNTSAERAIPAARKCASVYR